MSVQFPHLRLDMALTHKLYAYKSHWPSRTDNNKDTQVLTAVRKNIVYKVIIDN